MRQEVTIRVPASTSNLGPGFDCLGVALRIYNELTVIRGAESQVPSIAAEAAKLFFKRARVRPFPFSCSSREQVPRMRGLGSSATIRLAILAALNRLYDSRLSDLSIFDLCAELEGHPDNAAPSLFGGFTVTRPGSIQRFKVSSRLSFVLLVPNLEIKTASARKILPAKVSRSGAVQTCGNACAITAAFASRCYQNLQSAFTDHLHQPFRIKLIPMLRRVIASAEQAGALGAFLSGSGSTICAVTLRDSPLIADAMLRAAKTPAARIIITTADNRGLQVQSRKSETRNF